jgi:hypothetical protein
LAQAGTPLETISRVLNHVLPGVTARHYIAASFDREKAEALARWEAELWRITTTS